MPSKGAKHRRKVAASRGAGAASLDGYEYQIDVSVWLALDLVLASKLAQEVILEPCSQEDLEAELSDLEPAKSTSVVPMDGYRLVVQVKLRTGDAWTVSSIKSLLNHGSDARLSAAKRLIDSSVRYLLVTSAALNGGVKKLGIRRAGNWPALAALSRTLASILPADAKGRIAVIGNQDEERLTTDIKRLLTENFRVPNAKWQQCHQALREEARIRIRSAGGGVLRREDLERAIRIHEGYIASSPELEHYVKPTNWQDLKHVMANKHAALIVGQSGTGKTLATLKLFEELREQIPGLSRVAITHGPQQLLNDQTQPPVLYDIEDPWGRYDFDPSSRPWNDQLAAAFGGARHNRLIVATSRLDVAQASRALESVEPWQVRLESEHYGPTQRRDLYRTRIPNLPRRLQPMAAGAEVPVLCELATPLEIQKFFDALPNLDSTVYRGQSLIKEAIREAHHSAIERTVIEQIAQRNDTRAAAVIWGLLKANSRLSLRTLRTIEEKLADRDEAFESGIEPLAAFFIAARNLRQTGDVISYYHPRVEAGIEQALLTDHHVARKALRSLVDVLTSATGPDQDWGTKAAAFLIQAADRKQELKPTLSDFAQNQVDLWLSAQPMSDAKSAESHLECAAAAGSGASTVSELARYLLYQPDKDFPFILDWEPPERDDAWYARLQGDPATAPLLDAFIRYVLPSRRTNYPPDFATELRRLAPPMTPAFHAAAMEVVHYGFLESGVAIAEGALDDIVGFESIIDSAVAVLTPGTEEKEQSEREGLAIINGEYGDEYADYLSNVDDGHTAGEFLRAYVGRIRRTSGWRNVASHRHSADLIVHWLSILGNASGDAIDPEELVGAICAAHGHRSEDRAWFLLLQHWQPCLLDSLIERVRVGHVEDVVREAALACLILHAKDAFVKLVSALASDRTSTRAAGMAVDLAQVYYHYNDQSDGLPVHEATEGAINALPAPLNEVARAAIEVQANKPPALSCRAINYLATHSGGEALVRLLKMRVARFISLPVEDDVRWLLNNTNDDRIAEEAVESADRHGLTTVLHDALHHRFARASAKALRALAEPMPAPLPEPLLAVVGSKSRMIRQALVEILDRKANPAHLDALLQLAGDRWTGSWVSHGEEARFPIAQAAVKTIGKFEGLGVEPSERLWKIAIDTSDSLLRREIFCVLAELSGEPFDVRLLQLATSPGRVSVREAAAFALFLAHESVSSTLIEAIGPKLLLQQGSKVAVPLTLLWALRADPTELVLHASKFASYANRRVLVLLVAWILIDRDAHASAQVAELLPSGHVVRQWLLDNNSVDLNDAVLADLGGPLLVETALLYVGLKPSN